MQLNQNPAIFLRKTGNKRNNYLNLIIEDLIYWEYLNKKQAILGDNLTDLIQFNSNLIRETLNGWIKLIKNQAIFGENLTLFYSNLV